MSPPIRRRGQDQERGRTPSEVFARQGTQGDQHGGGGGTAEHDAPHARPGAASEPDPVQADEGEGGARRVTRDMCGPVAGRADHDVVGEAAQRGTDVVEAVDHPQVLVLGGQPARHAPVPALDECERQDPGHRTGPAGEEQPAPGKRGREAWPVRHDRDRDPRGERGAGTHVRVPRGEQGRPVDLQAAVALLDHPSDHRGHGDQQGPRHGRCQVPSATGGAVGNEGFEGAEAVAALLGRHPGTLRIHGARRALRRPRVTRPSDRSAGPSGRRLGLSSGVATLSERCPPHNVGAWATDVSESVHTSLLPFSPPDPPSGAVRCVGSGSPPCSAWCCWPVSPCCS